MIDKIIFDDIVEKYYNSILRYCQVRLGNQTDAYDCTQEVFVILLQKSDKLTISENIRAWLYRTADNVINNFKRKNSKYISLEDIPEIQQNTDFSCETPMSDVISEEEYQLIKAHYIDKEGIDHIAGRLGISSAAAAKRIYRIKARIVKYMENNNKK